MSTPSLFSALKLGPTTLRNRILLAPLTRNRADANLVPTALMQEYYTQRSGAGLVIAEATQCSPYGQGYPLTPSIHTQEQVAGWRKITDAVHAQGAPMFLQLWHTGRISHSSFQPDNALPIAPSAIKPTEGQAMTMEGPKEYETPREATLEEIQRTIGEFKQGAVHAQQAGFDGIEIHAANGYLIDQFFRDGTNHRTDAYGGSKENRFRFVREILEAVFEAMPADRVGIRLSPGGTFSDMHDSNTLEHFSYFISELNKLGLAYLHIKESDEQDLRHGGEIIPLSTWRALWDGVLIANTNYDQAKGEEILSSGSADAVAYGRPFIRNPDLVERFKTGSVVHTDYDYSTFFGGSAKGYTDYKTLVQEQELSDSTDTSKAAASSLTNSDGGSTEPATPELADAKKQLETA